MAAPPTAAAGAPPPGASASASAQAPTAAPPAAGSVTPPSPAAAPPATEPVNPATRADQAQAPAPAPVPAAAAPAPPPEDQEGERQPRRRKRVRRYVEVEDDAEGRESGFESSRHDEEVLDEAPAWRPSRARFIVGVERITSVVGWSETETLQAPTGSLNGLESQSVDFERSGTTVSVLGAGFGRNFGGVFYGVPRVAFDGRFENGFTLGGAVSFLSFSTSHDEITGTGGKTTVNEPTVTVFVLAPRLGVLFESSRLVSVWLRGGITRVSLSADSTTTTTINGVPSTSTSTSTVTALAVTLDPQVVFTPVPHVGISVGPILDIGVSGSAEEGSTTHDFKASSYGATAGLVAMF